MNTRRFSLRLLALLIALPFVLASSSTRGAISSSEAKRAAQVFIDSIARYSAENPDAPAAVPDWTGGLAGSPFLVHGYPGLDAAYYLAAVESRGGVVVGVVGMDPATGKMWWYSSVPDGGGPFPVDRARAREAASSKLGRAVAEGDAMIVAMPDKRLYWLFRQLPPGDYRECFVSVEDESDVHTDADAAGAGLTTPLDDRGPRFFHPEEADGGPAPEAQASFPLSYNIVSVPHHYQVTDYHCGPASDEMVYDYWGPDVSQTDIGHVANCKDWGGWSGSYSDDNRRAAHFSAKSTAVIDPNLHGYHERGLGYAAMENWWSYPDATDLDYPDRYNDLKSLVSNNDPVYVLTHYDSSHESGHFRVVKGYNDTTNPKVFIVHDPWHSAPYYGPNVNFEQIFFVDNLWTRDYRWGLHVAPWKVEVQGPQDFACCAEITVTAGVEYRGPHPFWGQYPVRFPQAAITLPAGYSLASGEVPTKALEGISYSGTSGTVSWQVVTPCTSPAGMITVLAEGEVSGSSSSYPSYSDWIGGQNGIRLEGGTAEVCDGIDNDCDASIDEGFADQDADHVVDCRDNCPSRPNAGQGDFDGDGVGDACETGAALADANNSGRVDGFDLAILGRAFGVTSADARYDRRVDLDRNQRIDGDDLALLTAPWGGTLLVP